MLLADGKWLHTSSLMAMIANCHRDPKKGKPIGPSNFPLFSKKKEEKLKVGVSVLRDVFVAKAKP